MAYPEMKGIPSYIAGAGTDSCTINGTEYGVFPITAAPLPATQRIELLTATITIVSDATAGTEGFIRLLARNTAKTTDTSVFRRVLLQAHALNFSAASQAYTIALPHPVLLDWGQGITFVGSKPSGSVYGSITVLCRVYDATGLEDSNIALMKEPTPSSLIRDVRIW
jgi:hypothetical protein